MEMSISKCSSVLSGDFAQKNKDTICAVIVSYNSPENLEACVHSSLNQVDKIIVIDNSSNLFLRRDMNSSNYPNKVSFIFNETNKGLGVALNQGIQYSLHNNYTWTLLLDQDSIPAENMIHEMIHSYENLDSKTKEETALIVPAVFDLHFKKILPAVVMTNLMNKKLKNPKNDSFVHFHITSGTLIKNEVIPNIGLMNENFFIDFIDFDYCFRVLNNNLRILLSKEALLYHSLAEHKQKFFFHFREHNHTRVYYQTRNRLFTLCKYGGKYKSFLYSESCRLISKFLKILFLESDKTKKIEMYLKGIIDFMRSYRKINSKL